MTVRTGIAAALAIVAVVAGCGPTPPQAPLPEAMKLDSALSGIANSCGLTYQMTALAGAIQPDLSGPEAAATHDALKLASVYAHNPKWIYQGETVATIVNDSVSTLAECGLVHAKAALARAVVTASRAAGQASG